MLLAIRSFVNLLFLGVWTAFMVTYAVTAGVLRGDPLFFHRAQRDWARGLVKFWGVELEVHGAENMDAAQSYVVMSNHLSYVDIVALFLALPVIPGFLAKRELARIPFLAQALRSGGHVIIDRGRHDTALSVINGAAAQVRGGKNVLIFPEGTRGDSDTIGAFKKGGFYLAKAAEVAILPVGVRGSRQIFPRGGLLLRPGKVEVHIGAAIPAQLVAERALGEMMPLVRGKIMDLAAMPAREVAPGSPQPA